MANTPGKPLPSKYVIAQPESYAAFDLSAPPPRAPGVALLSVGASESAQKTTAQKTISALPKIQKIPDIWAEAEKNAPKVKDADKDKFESPDDMVAGPTIKKFTASSEALDQTPREKRAVWVVHGMGQQIPFETLDSLATGILDALPNPTQSMPRMRTVKIADQVLQRVELDIDGVNTEDPGKPIRKYELHLYETYWAPKTEGVANLRDVVSFLWDGALRGLLNSIKAFRRAMFGGMSGFYISWMTPVSIGLALLILLIFAALTEINAAVLAAASAQTGIVALTFLKTHWPQFSALASSMVAVAFSFGAVLFVADLGKPQELTTLGRILLGGLCWISMLCTMFYILGTAILIMAISTANSTGDGVFNPSPAIITMRNGMEWLFKKVPGQELQGFAALIILVAGLLVATAMTTSAVLRSSEQRLQGHLSFVMLSVFSFALNIFAFFGPVLIFQGYFDCWTLPGYLRFLQNPGWVGPLLIIFGAKVREILVQYVGDVAIYVRPNKLDRFDEVRAKIKEAARSVVSALFTAYRPKTDVGAAPEFEYDQIALVGHSLGSVIAYDTLNRLMLDDWLCDGALQVAERTATMVTFGSPLDKTAFLFTIQGKDSMYIRERLACTVQPLITSYPKFRKFTWINVYSRNDIVSGLLKFYDLPGYQNPPVPAVAVQNVKDRDAAVPLMAHVAYWKNKTVWRELLSQIAP